MNLTPWDLADLDRLAADHAEKGKRRACQIYTQHALALGWHGYPAWIEGRTAFMTFYRRHRAEYVGRGDDVR